MVVFSTFCCTRSIFFYHSSGSWSAEHARPHRMVENFAGEIFQRVGIFLFHLLHMENLHLHCEHRVRPSWKGWPHNEDVRHPGELVWPGRGCHGVVAADFLYCRRHHRLHLHQRNIFVQSGLSFLYFWIKWESLVKELSVGKQTMEIHLMNTEQWWCNLGLLLTMSKFFIWISSSKSSNIIVLFFSQIMGMYFMAMVVLMRMNMPVS